MSKRIGDESGESVHKKQPYEYYCVLDFEATCEEPNPEGYEHEIIEFPVVLLNASDLKVKDTIQIFVKPRDKPHLSDFCTRLTGISQQQVDAGISLTAALHKIHGFLASHGLVEGKYEDHCLKPGQYHSDTGSWQYKFAFLTDGPWDLWRFLNPECQRKHIRKAGYYDMWVNVRYLFCEYHEIHRSGKR